MRYAGGLSISKTTKKPDTFARLEGAVSALAKAHRVLGQENLDLRGELDDMKRRVRMLDTELLAANQRRQDAQKRIGELIAHLDQLETHLGEVSE